MTNRAFDYWVDGIRKRPILAVILASFWVFIVGWIAFLWNLGNVGLVDETEPLFAEASRQMLVTGNWITPYFNGETRFDKPALVYWLQGIAYAVFGVNEWAVRLPSALAAIGLIGLSVYVVNWYLTRKDYLENISQPRERWLATVLAAALIGLSPLMIVWGRTGVSDMLLTGCIASSLLCFFMGYAEAEEKPASKTRWYLASYILIGAGILTKGPVGAVLPGLIIVAFTFYLGNWRQVLKEMRPLIGVLIVSAISLPWYILVTLQNGQTYIDSFFGYHNVERFTEVVNGHSAPWYFYFIVVLLGFTPYSVYLPVAMANLKFWQRKYWMLQPRSQQLGLFCFFWFTGIFAFFTIAVTKLPSYVLPLMPAAGILVALLFQDLATAKQATKNSPYPSLPPSFFFWSGWVNVVLLSAFAGAMFYIPKILGPDEAAPKFRELIDQSILPEIGSMIFLLAAILVSVFLLTRRWQNIIDVNLLAFVAFFVLALMPAFFLVDQERQLPLRQLSEIVIERRLPNEELMMVGFKKPTVTFYTRNNVIFQPEPGAAQRQIQDLKSQKGKSNSLLIITQPEQLEPMGLLPSNYENIATKGAYQLVRIRF